MSRFERRALDPSHLRPRRTAFTFPSSIPKHWLAGSPTQSHFFNAINLFVVSFEEFMVRVMRDRLPELKEDTEFSRQVRGFMGQEATHSYVHEKFLNNLREQGYQIEGYLSASERIFTHWFEKGLGQRVSMSMIAGFEHLTALLAEIVLADQMMKPAEPFMAELWEWHAAEEIEHKEMAFELLRRTSRSYLLRMAGVLLGGVVVLGFIGTGMVMLLRQDGELWRKRTWRDFKALLFGPSRMALRSLGIFLEYFRPGFHPNQRDNYSLAESVFQRAK
ncbi:metal-dependent hydrolase [Hyalangium rubrum]|uniref:Metal-dependent hydrolase n=1 Tax=Hyalangium rubrum TaxID=3103134 RepID=A0ABU5HEU3_9BACT|nr:metal-dependent hydrolase [Hyalangium sp. s54d21]MDY7231995.1 metal-dependent hydrolase [Hyalangium sp. s54d21]